MLCRDGNVPTINTVFHVYHKTGLAPRNTSIDLQYRSNVSYHSIARQVLFLKTSVLSCETRFLFLGMHAFLLRRVSRLLS